MGYMIVKNIRATPWINSNMEDAGRAKSHKALMEVKETEVNTVKARAKGGGALGLGTSSIALIFVPLVIFIVTGQVVRTLFEGIESWQSFAIAFLLSMPFNLVLQARSGIAKGPIVTPNSYRISPKGIVFDNMGRSYILYFPLQKIILEEDYIEVESEPSKATIIPNRLKLFAKNVNKLHKLLTGFTETNK